MQTSGSRAATLSSWQVGAITAIPLAWADGPPFGALVTFHPRARTVPSGEIPLLRLAGRMVIQAEEAAAAREREKQWALQLARDAAAVESVN